MSASGQLLGFANFAHAARRGNWSFTPCGNGAAGEEAQTSHSSSAMRHMLDRRVTSALNHVFAAVDSAIVLEDDCLPDDRFFTFCSSMLDRYRDDPRVVHVSGECYRRTRPRDSYVFSKYPLAWGWAAWRRSWSFYDPGLRTWPVFRDQPAAPTLFDTDDERRYWFATFDRVHRGAQAERPTSWDYAWYYACMTQGLSIHPAVNLVSNIGYGPLASHTHGDSELANRVAGALESELRHPAAIVRDRQTDEDTFDRRFPGGILKQQRTLRHQLGRPARWMLRQIRCTRNALQYRKRCRSIRAARESAFLRFTHFYSRNCLHRMRNSSRLFVRDDLRFDEFEIRHEIFR